jgi:uncharacterized membrane protein
MANSLGKILIGLLLAVLDFTIGSFDILPDMVGYILAAMGCAELRGASQHFKSASVMAWVLFGLAVVIFAIPHGSLLILLALTIVVVDAMMMWQLLGGIMELAESKRRTDISNEAAQRRLNYVVASGLGAIMFLLIPRGGIITGLANAVLFICLVVVLCLILKLILQVKRELAN